MPRSAGSRTPILDLYALSKEDQVEVVEIWSKHSVRVAKRLIAKKHGKPPTHQLLNKFVSDYFNAIRRQQWEELHPQEPKEIDLNEP